MLFKLIENRFIEKTTVTIECKEKDKQVEQLIDFIENLDDFENGLTVRLNGTIYRLQPQEILYIESVDRKTFCYTLDNVYETNYKLYEIEEKYNTLDFMRVSKSCIVNLKRINTLKPDFGGRILATMDNNEKLYISRQYAPLLKKKLGLGGKHS